jgi:hypothetical protein
VTVDLTAFLRARLDEDEQVALAIEDGSAPWAGQWVPDGPHALRTRNGHVLAHSTVTTDGRNLPLDLKPGTVEHWARHDPKRVLAEVDAKRKIVDQAEQAAEEYEDDTFDTQRSTTALTLESVLHLLALPYANHPDYRPEWAPAV